MADYARLADDLKDAMRARDDVRVRTLRMVRAALIEAEKETGRPLDEAGSLAVITRQARQRRDSIQAYHDGGRDDLAAGEQAELAIIESYLPAPLTEDELRRMVAEAVAQTGATDAKQFGAVMRVVMPAVAGRADGARVSALVREALG